MYIDEGRRTSGADASTDMAAVAHDVAALLKVLAHPLRLQLACKLVEAEHAVHELERTLGIHQPSLSQQLGVLRDAGVVETRREGKHVFYRLTQREAARLIEALHAIFCEKDGSP